jgi:MGT family glycosyltransferase
MSSNITSRGRDRAHIAMVGTTTPSHIHPSLALIRELSERGHRVTYVVGERLASLVEPAGVEVVPFMSLLPAEDDPAGWPSDAFEVMALYLEEGIRVLPQLMDAYGPDRPNLVLHDIGGLAGPVAAAHWRVPAIQLSGVIVAWEGYEADMAEQLTMMKSSTVAQRFYAGFESWLTENGIARRPDDVLSRPEQGLVLIPRVLQPHADRVGPTFRFVGPCLDPQRMVETNGWTPPNDGRPLLYVSFGTVYEQLDALRACIEAFDGTAWHVVLSIGHRTDPVDLGPLPDNFEAHRTVPQLAVLQHASAFVTHAGMGSAMEALWFGVPMVAIPQAVDQFVNATRIAQLGIGRTVPRDGIDAQTLRDTVAEITRDSSVAERLTRIADEVRAGGGAQHGADVVESLLP